MPLKALAEKMTAPGQMIAWVEETRRGCQKRSTDVSLGAARRCRNDAKNPTVSNASVTPAASLSQVIRNGVGGSVGLESSGLYGELAPPTRKAVWGDETGICGGVIRKNSGTYEPAGSVICTACSCSLS